jgi:hypothetical protein
LLVESLKCPIAPVERTNEQGRKERVVSEFTFTGNWQRLSGYRIDTIRAYNPAKGVDVNLARVDLNGSFSDITQILSEDTLVALICNHTCFHVTETGGGKSISSDRDRIIQEFCNETTASNVVAAIETLVRANGGHLSPK